MEKVAATIDKEPYVMMYRTSDMYSKIGGPWITWVDDTSVTNHRFCPIRLPSVIPWLQSLDYICRDFMLRDWQSFSRLIKWDNYWAEQDKRDPIVDNIPIINSRQLVNLIEGRGLDSDLNVMNAFEVEF
jgi:hypothetical protein